MPFVQLLTALTAAFLGFIHPILYSHQNIPSPSKVLAASTQTIPHTTTIPTLFSTPTPVQNTNQFALPLISKAPLIACTGPDGKQLHITQKACEEFNNAWHHTPGSQTMPSPYGQATKVGEHTYELKVVPDDRMAGVQEVMTALNQFRQKNGIAPLAWSTTLGNYAQSRANFFSGKGSLDEHTGFTDFIHNHNGFTTLGFNHLGENSAYAGPLIGVHLIEWIFAADAEHNANQLNSEWSTVGIGISGIATDVVFGGAQR